MTTQPKPQMAKIRAAIRNIDAEPESWNQEIYGVKTACGTAHCIAGRGVTNEGIALEWMPPDVRGRSFARFTADRRTISVVAREIFGLTHDEADLLFHPTNSREDIERIAKRIAVRAGEPLWPQEVKP